jgi:hypothetical protein
MAYTVYRFRRGFIIFFIFTLIYLLGFVPERCGGLEADLEEIRYKWQSGFIVTHLRSGPSETTFEPGLDAPHPMRPIETKPVVERNPRSWSLR